MDTSETIAARRSIRRFRPDALPPEALDKILSAGMQAPSAKNRQPWRFTVVLGEKRRELLEVFREELENLEARGVDVGSARATLTCMEQAPVTVFVHNPRGMHADLPRPAGSLWEELADVQSIGAAIQNMLLAAQDLGIGSLWIGDVCYAYPQINAVLRTSEALVAAVCLGIPDESPPPRPRKARSEVVRFVEG